MIKAFLICILILSVSAGHVRKTHKGVQNKKTRTFNSAYLEFENMGEKDYHLSSKEAQHWAQITTDIDSSSKKHSSFVETNAEYVPGQVGDVQDLSKNAGVFSYTVTDINGNVLEQDAGDHLAEKFNTAYLQMTEKIIDSTR